MQLLSILKSNKTPFAISIVLGIFDNITKALIRFYDIDDVVVIENVLELDLNFNTGIAFGILRDKAENKFPIIRINKISF